MHGTTGLRTETKQQQRKKKIKYKNNKDSDVWKKHWRKAKQSTYSIVYMYKSVSLQDD